MSKNIKITDKEKFITNTLIGYLDDPNTCAVDKQTATCLYLTSDNKKCAVGKHLKNGKWQDRRTTVTRLFKIYGKSNILTEEAFNMNLKNEIWQAMQNFHDSIVTEFQDNIKSKLEDLKKVTGYKFRKLSLKVSKFLSQKQL